MPRTPAVGTQLTSPLEGGSDHYFGQPRVGMRVSTMLPEPAGPAGYTDPFGPTPVSPGGVGRSVTRTAGRRKVVRRQRFWGVAILVLFVLGVTAAKWFAQ